MYVWHFYRLALHDAMYISFSKQSVSSVSFRVLVCFSYDKRHTSILEYYNLISLARASWHQCEVALLSYSKTAHRESGSDCGPQIF